MKIKLPKIFNNYLLYLICLLILGIFITISTNNLIQNNKELITSVRTSSEDITNLQLSLTILYEWQKNKLLANTYSEIFDVNRKKHEAELRIMHFNDLFLDNCKSKDDLYKKSSIIIQQLFLLNDTISKIAEVNFESASRASTIEYQSLHEITLSLLATIRNELFVEMNNSLVDSLKKIMYRIVGSLGVLFGISALFMVNIFRRERAERNLIISRKRIQSIFNAANRTGFIITATGNGPIIQEFSSGARHIFGYEKENVLKQNIELLVEEEYHKLFYSMYNDALRNKASRMEMTLKKKHGEKFPALITGYPLQDEKGGVSSVLFVIVDIAELKMVLNELRKKNQQLSDTNEELQRVNSRLTDLDRLKSDFVSMSSHEFRTPLTAIIGMAQTLEIQSAVLSEKEKERILSIIVTEGKRLSALIAQLLDLTRIEQGTTTINRVRIEFKSLIDECLQIVQIPQSVSVTFDNPQNEDIFCFSDRDQIKQVLLNLIDNAIRYSGTDVSVVIKLKQLSDKSLRVDVCDNGPGISDKDKMHLFDMFYRGDESVKRKQRGSGLGLSIAKRIVLAHGGTMDVISEIGKGSDFYFILPCK